MIGIKKIWTWIKHHWHVPVIVLLIIIFSLSRSSMQRKMYELLEKQRENYKQQIKLLEDSKVAEAEAKEKAREKHENTVKNIEKEYNVELENLDRKKKKEISDVIKKYEDSPDDLAREVARVLSAEYLRTEWEKKNLENSKK